MAALLILAVPFLTWAGFAWALYKLAWPHSETSGRIERGTAILQKLAIVAYLCSLILPSYAFRDSHVFAWGLGMQLLLIGWVGALWNPPVFAWFANPLAVCCMVLSRKHPLGATAFSLFALWLSRDLTEVRTLGFDSSKDAYAFAIKGIGSGGYVWIFSLLLVFLVSVIRLVESLRRHLR